jgi:conjugal transfer ATP-binding protein TraC
MIKVNKKLRIFSENIVNSFLSFKEIADSTNSAPLSQLNALSQQHTLSQLLFYRYAQDIEFEDEKDDKIISLYTMDDKRQGFIFQVTAPVFLGDKNERDMHEFFNSIELNNVIVHINTFSSRNIKNQIDEYISFHNLEKANVKRRDILKELVNKRAEAINNWVTEPMGRNGVRIRNFVNTISILFPKDTPIDEIVNSYIKTETLLLNYNPRNFTPDKLVTLISEYLKPEELIYDKEIDEHQVLNTQMATGAKWNLNPNDGYMNIGEKWKGITLTTEKFPKYLTAFDFQSAFFNPFGKDAIMALSCPFICSLVIAFEDVKKEAKKTLKKAQWNVGQIHLVPSKDEKQNPTIQKKRLENENIVKYILDNNEYPVKAQWTLSIFDDSLKKLKKNTNEIKKKFKEMSIDGNGWILKEESYSGISFQSMLMGLPLQYSQILRDNLKRFRVLFKSNNSQIAPLIGGNTGHQKPFLMFPDRTGQLLYLNFLESLKNYNVTIVGPSGTGKSVLLNELNTMSVTANALVRIVDIGDSYKNTTNAIGGKFVEFDDNEKLCFNFFTNIQTKEIEIDEEIIEIVHEDELCTIVPIIGAMLKMNLRASSSENELNDVKLKPVVTILEESIQVAYSRQGKTASMQTIWEYLIELRELYFNKNQKNIYELLDLIIIGLHDYVIRIDEGGKKLIGKNQQYFNGVNNIEFDSSIFVFEMEKLTKKGDDLLIVISMIVLHQMANEAYFTKDRIKIIGVDEAKRVLRILLFADFLDDVSRRIRKYDGILVILTQYIKDFFGNKSSEGLFEGASFNIFLEQEEDSIEEAAYSGKLSMNDGQIALMKSVKARTPYYNEFMVKYGSSYMVLLNKLDSLAFWLYTTKGEHKSKINDVCTRFNLVDNAEGAWFMALVTDGMSEDEAYSEIIEKRKISN